MLTESLTVKDFKPMDKLASTLKNDKLKKLNVDNTKLSYEFKDGKVHVKPFKIKMDNTTGTIEGTNSLDQRPSLCG